MKATAVAKPECLPTAEPQLQLPAQKQPLALLPENAQSLAAENASQLEFGLVDDLPRIANPDAKLPISEIPNFSGGFVSKTVFGKGTTLYGIRDPATRQVWWLREEPLGELWWRQDSQVIPLFNNATHIDTLVIPKGNALIGFEGLSTPNSVKAFTSSPWYLNYGEKPQIYIPDVPKSWIQTSQW